jgi:phosphoribosyl 1,2-cyclic phosphate phosphodiesterase
MKLTVLGCGPSGGVPLIGNVWGRCDPTNPKNARLRTSLLVEEGDFKVLIDTSPDLRQQLLREDVGRVDAVLYTHAHSDHAHGIDELRPIYFGRERNAIPLYGSAATLQEIRERFGYLFATIEDSDKASLYPCIVEPRVIEGSFEVCGIPVVAFNQDHGHGFTTGFRFNRFAYSTDVKALSDEAFEVLKGVDVWFVDCLDREPRPTHAHLDLTLSWIELLRPRRTILIHMNHTMDYEALKVELPEGVEPAYDGMVVEV